MPYLFWKTSLDAEQRSFLADARQNNAVLVRCVGDALDYATLAAGEMSRAPEPASSWAVMDTAAGEHAEAANARGLELMEDVDISMPERVLGKSAHGQQVRSHFIETAVKVTRSGFAFAQVYLHPDDNRQATNRANGRHNTSALMGLINPISFLSRKPLLSRN